MFFVCYIRFGVLQMSQAKLRDIVNFYVLKTIIELLFELLIAFLSTDCSQLCEISRLNSIPYAT